MLKCLWCGEEIVRKNRGPIPKYCCRKHYWYAYYKEHKTYYNRIRSEWHKKNYKPHPKPLKYATKEERYEAQKQRRKEFYHANKEHCRQMNSEWYRKHRNDPDVKRRHALAMKKYAAKKKALKGGEKE